MPKGLLSTMISSLEISIRSCAAESKTVELTISIFHRILIHIFEVRPNMSPSVICLGWTTIGVELQTHDITLPEATNSFLYFRFKNQKNNDEFVENADVTIWRHTRIWVALVTKCFENHEEFIMALKLMSKIPGNYFGFCAWRLFTAGVSLKI